MRLQVRGITLQSKKSSNGDGDQFARELIDLETSCRGCDRD